jgi:hypothetical protein
MAKTKKKDEEVYGRQGVADGLDPKKPLECHEKSRTDRAVSEIECHDCGYLISKGESYIASSLECTQGVKGQVHRYAIHEACYQMVGQVVALLGKETTHTFAGRPSLRDLWKDHGKGIRAKDAAIADLLEGAFGQ